MIRKIIKSLLHKTGYELKRVARNGSGILGSTPDPDSLCASSVREAALYSIWSPPHPLYTPWVGLPDFMFYYQGVAEHTYVSPDRCYMLLSFARHALLLDGAFAECGVCKGGTALLLSRLIAQSNRRRPFYLFDSFEGLPKPDPYHDNYYKAGDFSFPNVEHVANLLLDCGDVVLKRGWIPETFRGLEKNEFSFVHIDVDIYKSTIDCCEFFYSRLVKGGIMIFDDYGFPACRGEKEAVDEFFASRLEVPFVLPTGQGIVIKS